VSCKLCSKVGRKAQVFARGLCAMHYSRERRGQKMEPPPRASVLSSEQIAMIWTSPETATGLTKRLPVSADYIRRIRRRERKPTAKDLYATRDESRPLLPEGKGKRSKQR
jgi:hypothetical protein